MVFSAFSVLSLSLLLVCAANAIMIPLRRSSPSRWPLSVSVSTHSNQQSYGFSNVGDDTYTATVYIQGHPFQVVLDTGSSDLWVQTTGITLDGLINTTVTDQENYGTPEDATFEKGYIALANVTFGPYTVNNQAMMNALEGNVTQPDAMQGILGISSANLSEVTGLLANTSYVPNSKPFLINLFETNSDIEPYYAIHLSRGNGSQGAIEGGSFAIGEVIDEWADVLKAPQVPIETPYGWLTFMDGIYIDDEWVDGGHTGPTDPLWRQPSSTQSVVLLDTGTSFVAADPYFVDAVYKNISGAEFNEDYQLYQIPCDTKLNVSVTIGGVSYPINPLDMIQELANGSSVVCGGTWQYAIDAGQDLILGDVFLKNVYTIFNLGNWTANHDYQPFVQFLSITNQTQALADYETLHNARIAEVEAVASSGVPPSTVSLVGAQTETWALSTATSLPTATAASHVNADLAAAAESSSESDPSAGTLARNEYIIMGLLGGVLVLLLAILTKLVQNGRNKQYRQVPNTLPAFSDKAYGE